MDQPGPRDFQSPDELKWTPNTAMEMRFGPDGSRRPRHKVTPDLAEAREQVTRKPSVKRRKPSEIFFTVAFGAIGLFMVAGAATFLLPKSPIAMYYDFADSRAAAEAPPADAADAAEEPEGELQGGVKVRKGFNK